MTDPKDPSDMAARIAAIKAKMAGGAAPAPAEPAADAPAAPATPADTAAPVPAAGGAVAGGDMAAKIAALKAKMGAPGAAPAAAGAPAAAPPAAASATAAKPAAAKPAAAPAAAASGPGTEAETAARVAALKAKLEAGKGATAPAAAAAAAAAPRLPPAPSRATGGGGARQIFPVEPIDRTSFGEDRLYAGATLNGWFTIGGIALLIMVVWMLEHDWVRDWKSFQAEFREYKIANTEAAIAEADKAIDPKELAAIEAELAAGKLEVEARKAQLGELQQRKLELEAKYYVENQAFQFAKSKFDAGRYAYEEQRLAHGGDAELMARSQATLDGLLKTLTLAQGAADNRIVEVDAVKGEIAALESARTSAEKKLAALTGKRDGQQARLAKIGHNLFNDVIRNAPIADMLAPTEKIEQLFLSKLKDNYNFMYVEKVDRCTTCHQGIGDKDFAGAEWDQPGKRVFMAHPNLDLFVSDSSPHPVGKFGCTVCHQGRGQAVEFPRTFHVPAADAHETQQAKLERWTEDYGYDEHQHYWDFPMVPADKLYSSCFQCHQSTDRIQGVPQYNDSRSQVEQLGCYGCHKIQGFEHLRKVGPDLTNLAAKTSEGWARKWVMDPKGFRPTTRMPHFWNQSNTGGEMKGPIPWNNNTDNFVSDWRARNDVEGRAVVSYVFAQSKAALATDHYAPVPAPQAKGDAAKGKELFTLRGCLGCHSMERDELVQNMFGPELSRVGSKVTQDWLHDWLLNPRKYYPTTVMPDLRLTDSEAWDIAAYLMQGKDPAWEALPEPKANDAILDSIAVEYLAPSSSDSLAAAQVAAWRKDGGTPAVEQYVGEKLFNRYGCAGCHLVPGHYEDKGVGTELTYEGLKELSKFDFGFETSPDNPQAIPYTRHDWFKSKLRDPRVFDRMPVVAAGAGSGHEGGEHGEHGEGHGDGRAIERYDMKVKAPGEKLKMPNFNLAYEQVEQVTQFLMGLRQDGIDSSMLHTLTGDGPLVEQASRLMTERNCMGCHKLGQLSRPMAASEELFDAGLWMAKPLSLDGKQVLAAGDWLQNEIYDPWNEEDTDTVDVFEEHEPDGPLMVYGEGEGSIAHFISDQALRPPVLRGEGAKVNPDWLFKFLLSPYIVRTHVNVRMPTFGFTPDQSTALVRWFADAADQKWPFVEGAGGAADSKLLAAGEARFQKLQCNSCHPAGGKDPSNPDKLNWGPNLSIARERLRAPWIHDWLKDPPALQPGSKMPSFFGEVKDDEYVPFVEDWELQVLELQQFLLHMNEAPPAKPVSLNK